MTWVVVVVGWDIKNGSEEHVHGCCIISPLRFNKFFPENRLLKQILLHKLRSTRRKMFTMLQPWPHIILVHPLCDTCKREYTANLVRVIKFMSHVKNLQEIYGYLINLGKWLKVDLSTAIVYFSSLDKSFFTFISIVMKLKYNSILIYCPAQLGSLIAWQNLVSHRNTISKRVCRI